MDRSIDPLAFKTAAALKHAASASMVPKGNSGITCHDVAFILMMGYGFGPCSFPFIGFDLVINLIKRQYWSE